MSVVIALEESKTQAHHMIIDANGKTQQND
jgi:hypothetical protein